MKKHLVVLSGAGISAESGLKTFRDMGGLWEGHEVADVATPEGWSKNPALVLQFYNERRRQLLAAKPNQAHIALAEVQSELKVTIVTQNVDDLHERAGSKNVIHLHGELLKVRSTRFPTLVYPCSHDIALGDTCERGAQLRPHIVWFGESVPQIEAAAQITSDADWVMIVGTSLQVYPAAGLMSYAPQHAPIYYIDPNPATNYEMQQSRSLTVLATTATEGVREACNLILNNRS